MASKLYVNLKKCSFMVPHVFLRFIVFIEGAKADLNKVKAI